VLGIDRFWAAVLAHPLPIRRAHIVAAAEAVGDPTLADGVVTHEVITPQALGLGPARVEEYAVASAQESARMVRDLADWVIIGHSERRTDHGETSAQVAAQAHAGQRRESGEPFISHVVAVCRTLLDLLESRLDTTLACAALLHDVVEDTETSLVDIKGEFGETIFTVLSPQCCHW
jgi:hypothetical protein